MAKSGTNGTSIRQIAENTNVVNPARPNKVVVAMGVVSWDGMR